MLSLKTVPPGFKPAHQEHPQRPRHSLKRHTSFPRTREPRQKHTTPSPTPPFQTSSKNNHFNPPPLQLTHQLILRTKQQNTPDFSYFVNKSNCRQIAAPKSNFVLKTPSIQTPGSHENHHLTPKTADNRLILHLTPRIPPQNTPAANTPLQRQLAANCRNLPQVAAKTSNKNRGKTPLRCKSSNR